MSWFSNVDTLEELKKQYKKLAFKHHPDLGGSTEDMQSINREYETLFEQYKTRHKTVNNEYYEKASTETINQFRDVINVLVKFKGINVEICGSWIWVTGNTKEYKDDLKQMKFCWSGKKAAWYYHTETFIKKSKRSLTLNEIRSMYGSARVDVEDENEQNRITA